MQNRKSTLRGLKLVLDLSSKNLEHKYRASLRLLQLLIYIVVVHQLMVLTLPLLQRHSQYVSS